MIRDDGVVVDKDRVELLLSSQGRHVFVTVIRVNGHRFWKILNFRVLHIL